MVGNHWQALVQQSWEPKDELSISRRGLGAAICWLGWAGGPWGRESGSGGALGAPPTSEVISSAVGMTSFITEVAILKGLVGTKLATTRNQEVHFNSTDESHLLAETFLFTFSWKVQSQNTIAITTLLSQRKRRLTGPILKTSYSDHVQNRTQNFEELRQRNFDDPITR